MSTSTPNVSSSSAAQSLARVAAQSSAASDSADKSRRTIAQNFDAFLSLLTTQLKNQSPLDPLDANQFTQQLVQFSSVEQQLKTNDLLSEMAKGYQQGANGGRLNAATAASLIGRRVAADASTQRLGRDANNLPRAEFPVTVPTGLSSFEVVIRDAKGLEAYRGPWRAPGTGEQIVTWDGRNTAGTPVDPAGQYTIEVTGLTANGVKSTLSSERSGIVTAVDLSGAEEMVQFGSYSLPLSRIKKVSGGI